MHIGNRRTAADDNLPTPQKRRLFSKPGGAALFVAAFALLIALAAVTLPPAWQATQRREAFLPQLEASIRRHPEDGALAALLAARLMEAGEFPAAAETLKQAAGAGAEDESVWLALASSNAAAGQRARALADLQIGAKTLPDATLLRARLIEAQSAGPGIAPVALARTINPQGPGPLLAVYGRGSFLNGLASWWGRRHPAQSGFATREAWAGARPDDAEAQRFWGMALVQNRRLPEAEAALRRAVALAPQSPDCRLALADALRQGGHLQEAAQQYVAALKLHPDWAPALMGLGAAFQSSGLTGYAINSYRRATQVAPRSSDAWVGLGTVDHQNNGGVVESVTAFETAARLAPDRIDYLDDYADALRLANRGDDAETVLRRRLTQVPQDAYAQFVLGMVLMERPTPERMTEAERHLREALRLSPNNPVAEVQLADLCLDRGQGVEAVRLLSDALRRLPFERRAMLLLARAYGMTGQGNLAARVAQQAAALQRDEDRASVLQSAEYAHANDIPFHQRLADLYDRIGKPRDAAKERLTIQRLQTAPQETVRASQAMKDAVNAVLYHH